MRNSQAKKQENRFAILDAAGRLFRERGLHNVSVAEVMQAADMTHGGFYRHFADKDDLIVHTVDHVLGAREGVQAQSVTDFTAYAASYLSEKHRMNSADGCLFAALGSEAARGSVEARHRLTTRLEAIINSLERMLDCTPPAERRHAAMASLSAMIGAMTLARICDDPALASEFLDGTRSWVVARQDETRP